MVESRIIAVLVVVVVVVVVVVAKLVFCVIDKEFFLSRPPLDNGDLILCCCGHFSCLAATTAGCMSLELKMRFNWFNILRCGAFSWIVCKLEQASSFC